MATSMNQKVEDHTALMISQLYTQIVSEQGGESKRRRRRKKNRGGGDGGAKKRKLSSEQARLLEMSFGNEHKLESERKERLASELGLEPRQVAVWFQNRRARWRTKKLEEEYSKLKTLHENVVLEKCRLESEVLKLKEQVIEGEKEIQRLSDNSPSSSLSMDAMEPPFVGEFGDIFYMPEYNYIHAMEWINPYL